MGSEKVLYDIERYKNRTEWLKARGIGGSEIACIVNKVGRWGTFIDVYDRMVYGFTEEAESESMSNGKRAEKPIKELFLIAHEEYEQIGDDGEILMLRRKDYPELTLSPDTLIKKGEEKGFVEIKLKQVFSEDEIADYMTSLREKEPQYWWQLIHYFVVGTDITFGHIAVCFDILGKQDDKWLHQRYVIEDLFIERSSVEEDIKTAESESIKFIEENIRPMIRPKTLVEGNEGGKIEWTKLLDTRM